MSDSKLSSKKWLVPPLLFLIGVVLQAIFSETTERWFDSLGTAMGYRMLLLIILLLVLSLVALWLFYQSRFQTTTETKPVSSENELQDKRLKLLKNLSSQEKNVLKKYIDNDTKTVYFHVQDGIPSRLASKGILFKPTGVSYDLETAYNLYDGAWETLKNNPKLLKQDPWAATRKNC